MSEWAHVDALKELGFGARAKALRARRAFVTRERFRIARNLVWRHFRRLPAELAIAVLSAGYGPNESLSAIQKHMPQGDHHEAIVAADWLRERGFTWQMKGEKPPAKMTQWQPMTPQQREVALALSHCRFTPASFEKRFARMLGDQARSTAGLISPKQALLLAKLSLRYRRQLADRGVFVVEVPRGG